MKIPIFGIGICVIVIPAHASSAIVSMVGLSLAFWPVPSAGTAKIESVAFGMSECIETIPDCEYLEELSSMVQEEGGISKMPTFYNYINRCISNIKQSIWCVIVADIMLTLDGDHVCGSRMSSYGFDFRKNGMVDAGENVANARSESGSTQADTEGSDLGYYLGEDLAGWPFVNYISVNQDYSHCAGHGGNMVYIRTSNTKNLCDWNVYDSGNPAIYMNETRRFKLKDSAPKSILIPGCKLIAGTQVKLEIFNVFKRSTIDDNTTEDIASHATTIPPSTKKTHLVTTESHTTKSYTTATKDPSAAVLLISVELLPLLHLLL